MINDLIELFTAHPDKIVSVNYERDDSAGYRIDYYKGTSKRRFIVVSGVVYVFDYYFTPNEREYLQWEKENRVRLEIPEIATNRIVNMIVETLKETAKSDFRSRIDDMDGWTVEDPTDRLMEEWYAQKSEPSDSPWWAFWR